jgi:hypothetical protein
VGYASGAVAGSATRRVVRVLRWTFRRDADAIVSELGLASDDSAYELRIERGPLPAIREQFHDVASAFDRQGTIERQLIADGWSLERFASDYVERR